MMTAAEAAAVDAELERALPWTQIVAARIARRLANRLSGYELHAAAKRERKVAGKNAAKAKRRAAKMRRTPPWADPAAIRAVYAEARRLTAQTGMPHHVDHIYPLQGRLVSGLHVAANLQVLPGVENMRKNNRFEP